MKKAFYTILYSTMLCIILLGCSDPAEIDAAAKKLLEENIEEWRITADEACLEKRPNYIKIYKDSLAALKNKPIVPQGNE